MQSGSIRLFGFAGIEVFLHFSWFLVAAYQLMGRATGYESRIFAVYEYVGLFLIVLLHEFGHAFACRQVGGIANRILLWPFGGIAFVQPPPRAGAQLWSIAAGPLVNVVLMPLLFLLSVFASQAGWAQSAPDIYLLIVWIGRINIFILVFNLFPIYPLDGGQILRSLLWFLIGPIKSLRVASVIGLIGGSALALFALWLLVTTSGSFLFVLLSFFLLSQAIEGWKQAKALQLQADEITRRGPVPPPVL